MDLFGLEMTIRRKTTGATGATMPISDFESRLTALGKDIYPKYYQFTEFKNRFSTSADAILALAARPEYASAPVWKTSTSPTKATYYFELTAVVLQVELSTA